MVTDTTTEVLNGALVAGLIRVCSELAVQLLPCEPLRRTKCKNAVGHCQVNWFPRDRDTISSV